jgi:hypothetical protein
MIARAPALSDVPLLLSCVFTIVFGELNAFHGSRFRGYRLDVGVGGQCRA